MDREQLTTHVRPDFFPGDCLIHICGHPSMKHELVADRKLDEALWQTSIIRMTVKMRQGLWRQATTPDGFEVSKLSLATWTGQKSMLGVIHKHKGHIYILIYTHTKLETPSHVIVPHRLIRAKHPAMQSQSTKPHHKLITIPSSSPSPPHSSPSSSPSSSPPSFSSPSLSSPVPPQLPASS